MRHLTPTVAAGAALPFCDTEVPHMNAEMVLRGLNVSELELGSDCSSTIVPPPSEDESDLLRKLPVVVATAEVPEDRAHLTITGHEIGRGAMGRVEVAQQLALQREVAVKSPLHLQPDSTALVQLLREGRVTGWLAHPNVVPVYMLGKDENKTPLLVMKRISGAAWSRFIADPDLVFDSGHQGDLLAWHIDVLMQVCKAVHYSHSKGIVHRDLKPDNIMIGEFGEIYVLDWGLAVSLDADNPLGLPSVGSLRALAGTPGFMPPEMVRIDNDATGVRSDVYLLGGILHSIVTGGKARHAGESVLDTLSSALTSAPYIYDESVPAELAAICNRATAHEPEERFASADAFRRALADFLRHRHSTRLCQEAQGSWRRLEEEFDSQSVVENLDADAVYRLFGACRFGFRQALREWEDNMSARDGLQVLLERMVDYEIQQGDLRAATKLLADLPMANPELEYRVQELRDELAAQSVRLERLQELARQNDGSVGRKERTITVVAMGLIWGGFYALLGWLTRHGVYAFNHQTYLAINGLFGLFLAFASWRWRAVLRATTVNKNFLWSLWTAFAVALVWWTLALHWQLDLSRSMAVNILLYAVITWMAAAAVDRRICWAAGAYSLGGVYLSIDPRFPWEALAFATTTAMFSMAIAWARAPQQDLATGP